uniref:tRNA/rRNA methyltransferase SpoU type domain-containing protein n=1 Tax=Timema shepardi TaxID=629360 RepID=A0A7R9G1Z5_TIMSH|nr:unnamed protein product [Timema shepardi]
MDRKCTRIFVDRVWNRQGKSTLSRYTKLGSNHNVTSNIVRCESSASDHTSIEACSQNSYTIKNNIMTLVKSKNKREKGKLILLEGKRLIADAILSGFPLQMVFFSRLSDLKNLNLPSFGVQVYKLPYKTLSLWSDVSTSPGIVGNRIDIKKIQLNKPNHFKGIMKIPPVDKKMPGPEDLPLTILCDNIREPGNLGTILRTAAAVGCHQVLLTKGCVDLWSPKVLRSGAGSHFRLRIHKDVTPENYYKYIDEDSSIFLADNNVDIEKEEESLDNSSESDSESENESKIDSSEHDIDNSEPISQMNYDCISLVPYYSVNYTSQSSIVLVIGGETEGLSNFSYSLAYNRSGMRLNVPLSNNVNSLNTGTALGIIAFEIKRQFLSKQQIYKQDLKQRKQNFKKYLKIINKDKMTSVLVLIL